MRGVNRLRTMLLGISNSTYPRKYYDLISYTRLCAKYRTDQREGVQVAGLSHLKIGRQPI